MSTPATPALGLGAPAAGAALVRWLRLDALMSGLSGIALAAGAPLLDGLLGPPVAFLVPLGLFLVAYAASLLLVGRAGAPAPAAAAVVGGNALWAAASVAVVLADLLQLTTAGIVVVLVQAAAVAVVAELQLGALRRRSSA